MAKGVVISSEKVEAYSPPDCANRFESRMLVDLESAGSERLQVNHFTLKSGQSTSPGAHRPPYDEVYFVLSGQATLLMDGMQYLLKANDVAFIPGGIVHSLTNESGDEDFVILTMMPLQPEQGVNELYDARKAAWGTSFRLKGE